MLTRYSRLIRKALKPVTHTPICKPTDHDHPKPSPQTDTKQNTILCSSDRLAGAEAALSRAQVSITSLNCARLLDNLLAFGQDEFDVARVGHVRVDLAPCQPVVLAAYLLP